MTTRSVDSVVVSKYLPKCKQSQLAFDLPTLLLGNLCWHINPEHEDIYWQKQPDQHAETTHPLHFTLRFSCAEPAVTQRSHNAVKSIADGLSNLCMTCHLLLDIFTLDTQETLFGLHCFKMCYGIAALPTPLFFLLIIIIVAATSSTREAAVRK